MSNVNFEYEKAFIRNLGIVAEDEQLELKKVRIAIPGLGGVGGVHLINTLRQGFTKFNIADLDSFAIENFNRQYGANLNTIDNSKIDVMKKMALEINPNAKINCFSEGVNDENLDAFLDDVDLVIDSLDVFAVRMRRKLINRAIDKGIPVIVAGPIGMGTSYICFKGNDLNFDEYFNTNEEMSDEDLLIHFLIGLSPRLLHVKYLIQEYINLKKEKVPSLNSSVYLAAGVAGIEAIKIILKRGKVIYAPFSIQYDVYRNLMVKSRTSGFVSLILFKVKVRIVKWKLKGMLN